MTKLTSPLLMYSWREIEKANLVTDEILQHVGVLLYIYIYMTMYRAKSDWIHDNGKIITKM